jgi:hypothetical protein
LSQLGIQLEVEHTESGNIKGTIKAVSEFGNSIFAKLGLSVSTTREQGGEKRTQVVGHDINDLKFIADLLKASNRRLVIEDFHYLTVENRKSFSHDLKAFWDYGLFVVIIGVWTQSNMLIYLNGDLSGRVEEISLKWSNDELRQIIDKGCDTLRISPSAEIKNRCVEISYNNAGILQSIMLRTLDNLKIYQQPPTIQVLNQGDALEFAAMQYAEQLNPLYQQFAKGVAAGIRSRKDSTGIYAHSMAVIIESTDEELKDGLSLSTIFERTNSREPRIQKGNLRSVLSKFDSLQVDEDGRGLVITFNPATEDVTVVDKQLLLYRKFMTVTWPWAELLEEIEDAQAQP